MQENATFFKRKEKKFLLSSEGFLNLKNILQDPRHNFKTDHLSEKTEFTFIENIYFDSPDLRSYHESVRGDENRFKLRIRSYSQDHIRDDDRIFFEVKAKENGETVKKRVAFKSIWLDSLLKDGSYPTADFVLLNSDKKPKKSLKILTYIIELIQREKFRPVLESSYVRYAFKIDGADSVRITIDRDLSFKSLIGEDLPVLLAYQENIDPNQVIVEIKYLQDEALQQLPQIMSLLGNANKFSKYCFGVFKSHQNAQMSPAINLDDSRKEKVIYPLQWLAIR